ncbi:pro-resilin-like [Schistocerca nitens]|uniref:pro-resilin-like n=1 Tax=Schistocerca nitens TaxID=7011 RepID=UPI0021174B67|nr:pro-resilin-like [Schistocerca nitens]
MASIKVVLAVCCLLAATSVRAALLPSGNTGFSRGSTTGGGNGYGGAAPPAGGFGGPSGGDNGAPQPYNFQYEVRDPESGNDYSQQESSDGQTVTGQFQVLLPDGRNQIVRYSASDATGFVADVQYDGGSPGRAGAITPTRTHATIIQHEASRDGNLRFLRGAPPCFPVCKHRPPGPPPQLSAPCARRGHPEAAGTGRFVNRALQIAAGPPTPLDRLSRC